MAKNAHIPEFGNWEGDGNVPYTKYFENARKGRSEGKLVNPNDPQENPDALSKDVLPVHAPPERASFDTEVARPKDEGRTSSEDGDQASDFPKRHYPISQKSASDSPQYRYGERTSSGDLQRKATRTSGGTDRSVEHSPLHPQYQVKSAVKGGISSPSWERKGSSEGSQGVAPNTPGKSRLRNDGRGDETSEKGSAVPKFGEWDESNPSSGDGFTGIFNKVKEERQGGSAKVPIISNDSTYLNGFKQDNSSAPTSCWCFSWGKKS